MSKISLLFGCVLIMYSALLNGTNLDVAIENYASAPVINQVEYVHPSCGNNNGSITITASGGMPPLNYSIDNGISWQSDDVFNNLAPGSYAIKVRDNDGFEAEYDSNPVGINMIPSPVAPASATANPAEVCSDYAGMIELRAIGGSGQHLIWYTETCDGNQEGIGVVINIPAPQVTTTYYALWSNTACGKTGCVSTTVTVVEPPTPSFAGIDQSICNDFTATLAANTPANGSGQWTTLSGPGTIIYNDPASPNTMITASMLGNYILQWTISNGSLCSPSNDDVSIDFGNQVFVTANSNTPLCEGEDLNLFSSIAGAIYSWTGPGGFTSIDQNPVITNASVSNSGEYTVTVSNIPGGCPATSTTIDVEVNNYPALPMISSQNVIGSAQDVCEGSTVAYSIAYPVSGSDYTWQLSGGGIINSSGSSDRIEVEWFAESGTYIMTVTEKNASGCESVPVALNINIIPASFPAISIQATDNPICAGSSVIFTASVTDEGATPLYRWLRNGIEAANGSHVFVLDNPSNHDQISCELTSDNPCASPATISSNTIELNVYDPLIISCTGEDPVCSGTANLLSPGNGYASYLWSDGSTGTSMTVENSGIYWVMVTDAAGCIGTDTIIVEPCITTYLHVPNAFTPNSDGLNDRFSVSCNEPAYLSQYRINIYNRWGQMVYTGNDIGQGWDGTLNGNPCQTDIYSYIIFIEITERVRESQRITGRVALIR